MDRVEKILLYLEGKMTEEELSEFKGQLKIDPDLMAELDIQRLNYEVSQTDNEDRFHRKPAGADDEYGNKRLDSSAKNLRKRPNWQIPGIVSGSAAAILILLFLLYPFMLTQEEIFLKYYKPFSGNLFNISTNNEQFNYPEYPIKLYLEGNYVESFQEIKIFTSNENNISVVSNFYLGLAAIENGENNLAISSLKDVLKEDFSFFHEHAQWYLTLVYFKIGKFDLAKENLVDLKLQKSIYSKNSKKILKNIPK